MNDTRMKILNAARDLFAEHGYYASSTRVIAREAGVNEVTLFRHFGSKEELLESILKQDYGFIDTFRDKTFPENRKNDIREDLRLIAYAFAEAMINNRKTIAIAMDNTLSRFDHHFLPFPKSVRVFITGYLEEMRDAGKIREADYNLITEQFVVGFIGRFVSKQRFGDGLITSSAGDFIHQTVEIFASYLEI